MSTILQSRPFKRPGALCLSPDLNRLQALQETKASALLPFGRDAFLPCRTPQATTFFDDLSFLSGDPCDSSASSSEDDEDRRNINDLLTGAFFNQREIIIQTDPSDQHLPFDGLNSPVYSLFSLSTSSNQLHLHALPPSPTDGKLLIKSYHEFAEIHDGTYPKAGLYDVRSNKYDEIADMLFGDSEEESDSDANDSSILSDQDDSMIGTPLVHSPDQSEGEEGGEASTPASSQEGSEDIPTNPSPSPYDDGDADGDDDMSFSGKDDDEDDGSDDDFVDPTFNSFCNQQRRALAQFEKKPSTPSPPAKAQTVPLLPRKFISLPTKHKSASAPPKPSPAAPPHPPSVQPSSRKRKARPSACRSSHTSSGEEEEEEEREEDQPPSNSPSKMYTVIREKTGKSSYQCNLCPEVRTKAFGDMKRHLESLKHKAPSYKCDADTFPFGCGKVFTRNDALKRHILSQHPIDWALYEDDNFVHGRKRIRTA